MNRALRCSVLGLSLCLWCACIELPDFPPSWLVQRPRVLAVIAEPPEFSPGQDVKLSVMVSSDEVELVQWRLCPGFYVDAPMQYDEGLDDQGCAGSLSWSLPAGPTTTLPGSLVEAALNLDEVDVPQAVLGVQLSPERLRQVIDEVGFPLQVEVRVEVGGQTLTALKRVLVSRRPQRNSNPPPPHLRLGEVEIVHREGFACATQDGEPAVLPAGEQVEVVPIFAGFEEPWTEAFYVLDAKGQVAEREEVPFYSYFSNAGRLGRRTTRAPLRNNLFRVPELGCARIWVVQQDGHAGASACSFVVWSDASTPEGSCDLPQEG